MARVIMLGFSGAQTLDLTGPTEVFAMAARLGRAVRYQVLLASPRGGSITTSSGLGLQSECLNVLTPRATDTVLVSGGEEEGVRGLVRQSSVLRWLRSAAQVARVGSVCSGAFVLAAAGILDGLRAATHWSACERLQAFRPAVRVDPQAIFVQTGRLWTSAGVTTGIDVALAMLEEDHGRGLADAVASQLVLYVRRPGFQAQFSEALVAQVTADDPLAPALRWARAHLAEADVPGLARRAGFSVRTLHRRCKELTGGTPRALLERLRVEHARTPMRRAKRAPNLKQAAHRAGFHDLPQMNRAFQRTLGLFPRE